MVIFVYHSIGDILFCEPIYRHFWKRDGIKPRVIIRDHLMWLQQYIDSAKFLPASTWGMDPERFDNTPDFLNLRFANPIYRGYDKYYFGDFENCMLDKYRLAGLDPELWKTIDIKLPDNEFFLEEGFKDIAEQALYNPYCQAGIANWQLKEGIEHLCMRSYSHATVIDWWKLIRDAKENHHVSTCTFFLMQAIKNKFPEWNAPCYIYPRPNEDGLRGVSNLHPDFNLIRVQ